MKKEHTDREKLQALLDGKVIKYSNGDLYKKLDSSGYLVWCAKNGKVTEYPDTAILDLECVSLLPEWYEDIPEEGILCIVLDDIGHRIEVTRVISYNKNSTTPYGAFNGWKYYKATPLTQEKVKVYMNLLEPCDAL